MIAALLLAPALTACNEKTSDPLTDATAAQPIKLDAFCVRPDLASPLRETTVIVDTTAIQAATPEEFRLKNPSLFQLVIGLADPSTAIASGASASRENVNILAGSLRSGTLTQVFSGCLPGASAEELAKLQSSSGNLSLQSFLGSDPASTIRTKQGEFTRQLLVGMVRLDQFAEPPQAGPTGDFSSSQFVKLLRPLGPPATAEAPLRRLFIFTNLDRSLPPDAPSTAEARTAGFKAATEANLNLALSEVYVISPGNVPDDTAGQFLQTFLLGSKADLKRVGGFSANGLSPPATSVVNYSGKLTLLPGTAVPMTMRIANTSGGQMVDSWISYTASYGQRATPLAGLFNCSADRVCTLQSDPAGGLGQLWRIKPGPEPEVREDAPLGGLRFLDATETPSGLQGRIFDPIISIGQPGGGLSFTATRTTN